MRLRAPGAVPPTTQLRFGPINLSAFETQKRNVGTEDGATLRGFPVGPGRISAPASVLLGPQDFSKMAPGSILVCPTTTPAWTPLFAQARGLVTDIGGILAHGSIVAREYGIPPSWAPAAALNASATAKRSPWMVTAGSCTWRSRNHRFKARNASPPERPPPRGQAGGRSGRGTPSPRRPRPVGTSTSASARGSC
jgi:phosphohistidine swiveling domain-containing protein